MPFLKYSSQANSSFSIALFRYGLVQNKKTELTTFITYGASLLTDFEELTSAVKIERVTCESTLLYG